MLPMPGTPDTAEGAAPTGVPSGECGGDAGHGGVMRMRSSSGRMHGGGEAQRACAGDGKPGSADSRAGGSRSRTSQGQATQIRRECKHKTTDSSERSETGTSGSEGDEISDSEVFFGNVTASDRAGWRRGQSRSGHAPGLM